MNEIQVTKQSRQQCNRFLDAVVMIIKCKKIKIYHYIYIKVFSGGILYYLTGSTDDVLNTTDNDT